jgi:predicted HTH transcriptional regulator
LQTDELESLLQGAEETPSLEFKGAMDWNVRSLAKDILAMANVQDGGLIVFGVEDGTFRRLGLSAPQMDSFQSDVMKDQMANYADPHVKFRFMSATDQAGLRYAIIEISPFDEIPVICKCDDADVQAGVIYYRSNQRRPQSARVSNSHDMRDIIERAAVRQMSRYRQVGLVAAPIANNELDEELGGL